MILETRQLQFSYGSIRALTDIDLAIRPGITAILGPNAAGKSTLLRCLCGLLKPDGDVSLDGRNIRDFRMEELAQIVSYLPQSLFARAALTVFETVLLGRLHRLGWHIGSEDIAIVQSLLEDFDLAGLGRRYIAELSGGQAQLVFIAQALARQPTILLLDEPNANLDLQHQFEICERLRHLSDARGLSVAMSVHDVNLAARVADTVYVLENGRIRCSGTPREALTEEMLGSVYGIAARVTHDAQGRPFIMPTGLISHHNTTQEGTQ